MGNLLFGGKASKVEPAAPTPLRVMTSFPPNLVAYEPYAKDAVCTLDQELLGVAVPMDKLLRGRRVVLLGLPGAFTPNCHTVHVPGYVEFAHEFYAAGIDEIVCLTVNDVFVVGAWARALGNLNGVRVLADARGTIARAVGLNFDLTCSLGRVIMKRFSALIEDGEVRLLFVEPDSLGVSNSAAVPLLGEIKSGKFRRLLGVSTARAGDDSPRAIKPEAAVSGGSGGGGASAKPAGAAAGDTPPTAGSQVFAPPTTADGTHVALAVRSALAASGSAPEPASARA